MRTKKGADPFLRTSTGEDIPFLRQMLYEAAYWRGSHRPDLEVGLSATEISKLLANWGRKGDLAVVAEVELRSVGAAWLRFWDDQNHSFGYVSSAIPELGIGVVTSYRGQGIGRKLLKRLLSDAADAGTAQVSLSVERDNPAMILYQALGFKTVDTVDNAYTMVVNVSNG